MSGDNIQIFVISLLSIIFVVISKNHKQQLKFHLFTSFEPVFLTVLIHCKAFK